MNPILGMGIKRAVGERRPQAANTDVDLESQRLLLATSSRFYGLELDAADDLGCQSRAFTCRDKDAFLDTVAATDEQRSSLDGADLELVVSASFDSAVGRTCSLMAEWPAGGESAVATRAEVFRFVAGLPGQNRHGTLTIAGPYSAGCKMVEANSPEHTDIAAIADFFLPTAT